MNWVPDIQNSFSLVQLLRVGGRWGVGGRGTVEGGGPEEWA